MMGLTRQQSQCLAVVKAAIARNGRAPTCREICDALNVKSVGNAYRLLTALEERGYIRRIPSRARAIEIIDDLPFLAPDLQRAVRAFAHEHHIKPETAVAEAVRAYCGVAA